MKKNPFKVINLTLILLMVIASCTESNNKQQFTSKNRIEKNELSTKTKETTSFVDYFEKIHLIKKNYKAKSSNFNSPKFDITSKFKPAGAEILGRLVPINGFYFIIYVYAADIPLPILEMYDKEGLKIKQFELFNYGFCTDLDFDNHYSSFEVLQNDKIELNSFIEHPDSIEIVQSDTIDLQKETRNNIKSSKNY